MNINKAFFFCYICYLIIFIILKGNLRKMQELRADTAKFFITPYKPLHKNLF